jgi:hypothetical protein
MRQDMLTVGLGLAQQGRLSVGVVDAIVAEDAVQLAVSTDAIPVRRGLFDWLFFRSRAAVRRRLFGPPDAPTKAVFAQVKQRRVGEKGRDELRAALLADLNRFFDDELTRLSHRMLEAYIGHVQTGVMQALETCRQENTAKAERVELQLAALRQVLVSTVHLSAVLTACRDGLESVSNRFGQARPAELSAAAEVSETPPAEV